MGSLTVASLNTRGVPLLGSALSARYAAIGAKFEASNVDVVNLQEVHTWYHPRRLLRSMPSYRFVSFRPSVSGPAGGLLTLSRRTVTSTTYRRFPTPTAADAAGLPRRTRLTALLKGALLTHLADVTIINTHLLANRDGDWSPTNRHYRLHQAYLSPGRSPHCIDFLLLSASTITVESAALTFTDQVALPNGPAYATDHLGLEVHLTL
ncbi:endonuclease/exonuclease/phosphatase family protein [Kribbella sp. NPDC048928]|uniref:endonuclease/exonuclease/phosphatase family protein n=1 Tax=Kribbella sp. NPDC048928 TaxID=3364111 RepID=UPI0037247DE2